MNIEMFALYIFSYCLRFRNIHENVFIIKITFIMPYMDNNNKTANIDLLEIANFRKYVKIYTRENIYVYSKICKPDLFSI